MKTCIYCGKPFYEHVDRRPENEPVPRVTCGLYKDKFKADPKSEKRTNYYGDD